MAKHDRMYPFSQKTPNRMEPILLFWIMNRARNPGLDAPLTWRQRLDSLRNLPLFFSLVWQTSPWLMAFDVVLRIARSAIPVSVLYIGKLIIDQVVLLTRGGA